MALAGLLSRLYGPITALSNVQVNVMTALVSFDRVFEVLDLKPLIEDRPGAAPLVLALSRGPAIGRCRRARGRHRLRPRDVPLPAASEVSLASLESIALPAPERTDADLGVLHDVSVHRAGREADRAGRPVGRGQDHDHALVVAAV